MACYWLGKLLSRFPARVVFNSIHGRALYLERGYCRRNAVVVSNGFNTEYFQPNAQARQMQRAIWGIGESESVVGLVGRLNPVKDHPLFLKVAAQILRICRSVRFVCVGGGPQAYEAQLRQEAERLGLRDRILWVGESSDMSAVYNALDILALCSKEEGCPNVVGEAMACGVPCVVTDVGDAAYLLGDRKYVTPPGHPLAMAHAVKSVLDLSQEKRLALGRVARQRIIDNFSLHVLATRTEALLKDVTSEF